MKKIVHTYVVEYPDHVGDDQITMAHVHMMMSHPLVVKNASVEYATEPKHVDHGWYNHSQFEEKS